MTRVGLAGYGFAGRDIHTPRLLEAGLDVVAVSTRDEQRSAAARSDLPGVEVVDGLGELLMVDGLDLVVLATPSGGHAGQVRQVVDAGLPCVVDKPLALDAPSAAEVVRYAAAAGVPLTVFQNRRYDAEQATVARVVAEGLVGEPFRYEMRWERWRPVPKERWRETLPATEGGGLLLDLHTHLVDAAVQLFGPVGTVFATVAARTTTAEDDAFLVCTHDGGVVSHLAASSVAAAPGPRVRLLGTTGAYVLADFEGEEHVWSAQADAGAAQSGWLYRGTEREPVARAVSSQADLYRAVAAALRAPDPQAAMPVDPWDAVHTLAVVDAARASAAQGRVVTVVTPAR
ncbi:Gfo/Idh/MocA family protein [Phycicoccus sonneratiae]|uniref:Gfo/Idh/MocA family oxidoreductase n=1 Tax=Phycicoccus sonneratiae TaxID=2807628 RepID=A0ABS2CR93_9MICO|nr:Gfo/Idh/MocA family oxidoreductase [Phycicoccus sonneraticus]MBM6402407.1 Gfo/Idh/MocA family oxidoreductase [Phycicoccus sonneraticus]